MPKKEGISVSCLCVVMIVAAVHALTGAGCGQETLQSQHDLKVSTTYTCLCQKLVLLVCVCVYSIDYNLEAAESDKLMLNLLELREDSAVDQENAEQRSSGRHPSLFGLYPLLDRGEAKETRSPAPPPSEHKGLRLHVKVSELKCVACGML